MGGDSSWMTAFGRRGEVAVFSRFDRYWRTFYGADPYWIVVDKCYFTHYDEWADYCVDWILAGVDLERLWLAWESTQGANPSQSIQFKDGGATPFMSLLWCSHAAHGGIDNRAPHSGANFDVLSPHNGSALPLWPTL